MDAALDIKGDPVQHPCFGNDKKLNGIAAVPGSGAIGIWLGKAFHMIR